MAARRRACVAAVTVVVTVLVAACDPLKPHAPPPANAEVDVGALAQFVPNDATHVMLLNGEHRSAVPFDKIAQSLPLPGEVQTVMGLIRSADAALSTVAPRRFETEPAILLWMDGQALSMVALRSVRGGTRAPDRSMFRANGLPWTTVVLDDRTIATGSDIATKALTDRVDRKRVGKSFISLAPLRNLTPSLIAEIRWTRGQSDDRLQSLTLRIEAVKDGGFTLDLRAPARPARGAQLADEFAAAARNAAGPLGTALKSGHVAVDGDELHAVYTWSQQEAWSLST
jgi:hypothetical protein